VEKRTGRRSSRSGDAGAKWDRNLGGKKLPVGGKRQRNSHPGMGNFTIPLTEKKVAFTQGFSDGEGDKTKRKEKIRLVYIGNNVNHRGHRKGGKKSSSG